MSKYKLDDKVWVMFRNGDKLGYVPAAGIIESIVVGNVHAFESKEYSITVAPHIYGTYDEHEIFPTEKALFKHLKDNKITRAE